MMKSMDEDSNMGQQGMDTVASTEPSNVALEHLTGSRDEACQEP
jgi:hypothetical protein